MYTKQQNRSWAKVHIHIILRFYCCMTCGNIILMSFLLSLFESQTSTQALKLGEIYGFALHFRYSLHKAHQPECFELPLIFGFEQSSFGCRKKPSLTSLIVIVQNCIDTLCSRSTYTTDLCFSWLKQSLSMVIIALYEININFCGYSVVFCINMVELQTSAPTDIVWGNVYSTIYVD